MEEKKKNRQGGKEVRTIWIVTGGSEVDDRRRRLD